MKTYSTWILFIFFTILLSFGGSDDSVIIDDDPINTNIRPNILLVIADDMGLDATPGYTIGSVKPNMPTLQTMMNT